MTAPLGPSVVSTPADARALGTVLAVWAHPDDEAYLCAGLMALARQAGQRVVCVTATPGEHGTGDPEAWPPERLAAVRTREMEAAMAVLGVDDHRWLGFEDGTLTAVDHAQGTALVSQLLDDVQPDTIVSFGPDGMTGHPDHQAIARWVHGAWSDAGSPARLLQAGVTASFVETFADVHAELAVYDEGYPVVVADDDVALTVVVEGDLADVKLASLLCHASQVQPILEVMGEERYRQWWQTETFRAATR